MQKLKELARRGIAFGTAVGLLAGISSSMVPALVSADALNPLTERTLLLSSSAPGYQNTDGAGNYYQNGVTTSYAPPNSGANGRKTGETFTFKSSTAGTDSGALMAFTFQYCTTAAGLCTAPGNDTGGDQWAGDAGGDTTSNRGSDVLTGTTPSSDLNVAVADGTGGTTAPSEVTAIPSDTGTYPGIVNPDGSQGTFAVEYYDTTTSAWVLSTGWVMTVSNLEDGSTTRTGKNNYITLTATGTGATGITQPANTQFKIVFYGTNDNYITNPGDGAFFVKINDYASTTNLNFRDDYPNAGQPQNVVDGGVTVANVMNQSIAIHTKVLETLEFSVGTVDPDTGSGTHSACDAITYGSNGDSVITLGNPNSEDALETGTAHDAWSFWRLSSNSSNGATVYYSGHTLADTENDPIGAIYNLDNTINSDVNPATGVAWARGDNSAGYSHTGSEQFGLGLAVTTSSNDGDGNPIYVDSYDATKNLGAPTDPLAPTLSTTWNQAMTDNASDPNWHNPQLYPLVPLGPDVSVAQDGSQPSYGLAAGTINTPAGGGTPGTDARFAFSNTANTIPVPIASESTQVVNCSTGLMRYIGNIAATTPAGIYTTKINYLAAPQY